MAHSPSPSSNDKPLDRQPANKKSFFPWKNQKHDSDGPSNHEKDPVDTKIDSLDMPNVQPVNFSDMFRYAVLANTDINVDTLLGSLRNLKLCLIASVWLRRLRLGQQRFF